MAWPARLAESVLSGSDADTLGQDLWDRDEMVKESACLGIYFADFSTASSTYVDAATVTIRVPDYARDGDSLRLTVTLKKQTSGTATYRFQESGTPTNGTEATRSATTYAAVTSDVTVPDDTWAGTVKTFKVQVKTDGSAGNADVSCSGVVGSFRVVGA